MARVQSKQFPDNFYADGEVFFCKFWILALCSSRHYKGPSQVKKASAEERLEGKQFQQWKKTGNSNDNGQIERSEGGVHS